MSFTVLRLLPAAFRFIAVDVVRGRRAYFLTVLLVVLLLEALLAVQAEAGSEGVGLISTLGLWVVAGPLCRSWLDEDVRLGYAAIWLQKPLRLIDFYLARILALVGWSLAAALAVGVAALPAVALGPASASELASALLGVGWIPPLLVLLSFLGSAAGARNSGLFAYGMLFAGFALPGLADSLALGPIYDVLEIVFPPASAAAEVVVAAGRGQLLEALAALRPLLIYAAACAALGLAWTLTVPARLARPE